MSQPAPRILIVDDDAVIRRLLQVNFRLEGYEVATASTGDEALSAAGIGPTPDVIVLDVMMPDLDGWEVCRRLRSDLGLSEVPIVFLSARSRDEDRERADSLRAAAYLTKPFDPAELVRVVRDALQPAQVES